MELSDRIFRAFLKLAIPYRMVHHGLQLWKTYMNVPLVIVLQYWSGKYFMGGDCLYSPDIPTGRLKPTTLCYLRNRRTEEFVSSKPPVWTKSLHMFLWGSWF